MAKNNTKTPTSLNQLNFNEELIDHPVFQWLTKHRLTILYAFIAFVALVAITYHFLSRQNSNAEAVYMQATVDFNRFQDAGLAATEPAARNEAFAQLEGYIKEYPPLHEKYDGLIAETLIIEDKPAEAQQYAQLAFNRTQHNDSPFYIDFAKTSLLMSQKSYASSLAATKVLHDKMQSHLVDVQQNSVQLAFGPTLYVFNLIRLAVLQQQLGNNEEELKVWEKLKQLSNEGKLPFDSTQLQDAFALFNEGKATLLTYIENRINILSH